jgi:FkbH-like protein
LRKSTSGLQNREFIAALKTAAPTSPSPIFVCVCPPSNPAPGDRLEQELAAELAEFPMIRFLSAARMLELYPLTNYYDASTDELGHIPYTPEGYAAIGTAIARVFHASRRAPYKAIVLDCDNTLWRGICGEKGPHGIELDPPSRALQNFMKARQAEGMLLCVCSKNAPEDVEQVFEAHPEMPLRRSDFVGWRVNWRPKSENIQSLAAELSLGLDSFIFVDDNPMETAEVDIRCPGVLALTLPPEVDLIPRFLDHLWAFDQNGITAEDRKRTDRYRENAQRSGLLAESLSYADFLARLELEVEIRELCGSAEIARAAQMTQRTNQFNFTTRRFTVPDIRELLGGSSVEILTTFVRDRFGDYGQAGLLTYAEVDGSLRVHDFLLSCRVLGKGVEHAMVARLGQIAAARSLPTVDIPFVPTPKNTPARDFLGSLEAAFQEETGQGFLYRIPAEAAAALTLSAAQVASRSDAEAVPISPALRSSTDFTSIARLCCGTASILQAVTDAQEIRVAAPVANHPRDEMEKRLARIWERVLRVSPIGIHDNFFDLGGESLAAVRILADLEAVTQRRLPLVALVEAPTIAKLTELLGSKRDVHLRGCLVPIKSSGARPPFFCVHGVGGNVLEFMDLAQHFHADQPLYGIQAIGLNGTPPERKFTIEQMAGHYIREVREFQPEGPYYLGGSSFGGLVAYEMARQLTAAGQPVALVALFDTSAPGAPSPSGDAGAWRNRVDSLWYRVTLHWANVLVLDPRERAAHVRQKIKRITRVIGYRATLFRDRGAGVSETIQSMNEWASGSYLPGKYPGGITLFRATERPRWVTSERTLGWDKLVEGRIEIYDTPGHHADLVRNPRARVLAQQLDEALTRAHQA